MYTIAVQYSCRPITRILFHHSIKGQTINEQPCSARSEERSEIMMRGKDRKRTRSHDKSLQSKHRKNAGKSVQENRRVSRKLHKPAVRIPQIVEDQISFEITKIG